MQTPSHTLLGIQHDKISSDQVLLSAIGKAFARAYLNEVHEILQDDGYNEDDMAPHHPPSRRFFYCPLRDKQNK